MRLNPFLWRRSKRELTALEMADIIERFLDGRSVDPYEWAEFTERRLSDERLDKYRKQCDDLDPLVNSPDPMDPAAVDKLRQIIEELRNQPPGRARRS